MNEVISFMNAIKVDVPSPAAPVEKAMAAITPPPPPGVQSKATPKLPAFGFLAVVRPELAE